MITTHVTSSHDVNDQYVITKIVVVKLQQQQCRRTISGRLGIL
jgi:hypothetical protein